MSQTAYRAGMGLGYPGTLQGWSYHVIESNVNGEASAGIPFGVAVAKGTGDDRVINMVDGNSIIEGVAVRNHNYDPYTDLNATNDILPKKNVSTLRFGPVLVRVEVNVTKGDPGFVRHTANGPLTTKGAFRNTADSGNAKAIAGSFRTSALAGGLAEFFVGLV